MGVLLFGCRTVPIFYAISGPHAGLYLPEADTLVGADLDSCLVRATS
jgi:hypothetical protein